MIPGEWEDAFQGFGLNNFFVGNVAERRKARYWVTYDKDHLYIAMQTELPPWGTIDGKVRRILAKVFEDDHFEIHINPARASTDTNRAYYQVVGNCMDFLWNSQHSDEVPGYVPFNGDWTFKNSVKHGWWTWEMSTPVKALGNARITPGTVWGFKFVRSWHQPNAENFWPAGLYLDRTSYLQVTLDSAAPVVRLEDFGKWWEGQFDVSFLLRNPSGSALPLKVFSSLEEEGVEPKKLEKDLTLAAGGKETVRFTQPWTIKKSVSLGIRVTSPDEKIVYFSDIRPFPKPDNTPLWVSSQEKKEATSFNAFFYPGFHRLRCLVSFSNLKSPLTRAEIKVNDASGKEIGKGEIARFVEGDGETVIHLPKELAVGKYQVEAALFVGQKKVEPMLKDSFEKKAFPFEGNTLGISDKVLSPWTPLEVKTAESLLKCWGREHTLGGDGLLFQVKSQGTELLARPIALAAKSGGADLEWEAAKLEWTKSAPHEVNFKGSSTCDKLAATVSGHAEYDGMVKYELTIAPRGDGKVDLLDLVVPIRKEVATLLHACGDGCRMSSMGSVPTNEGRVWDSTAVGNVNLTGTFIPYLWLGNERLGLCWWADKAEGWISPVDKRAPAIEVVRSGNEVQMVFHLFAKPVVLKTPRKITFALEATPVRPKVIWARNASIFQGKDHKGKGPYFAWFGSCQWALSGKDHYKDYPYAFGHIRPVDKESEAWLKNKMDQLHSEGLQGLAYTDYRSRSYTPELRYYAWEWEKNGTALAKAQVEQARLSDLMEVNSAPSRMDYDLWCINENMKLGMDAWYFDEIQCTADRNPVANRGWLNEQGELEGECTLFAMRDYFKRLYTLMQERGVQEPLIIPHMTSTLFAGPFAFATAIYDYEYVNRDPEKRELLFAGLDGFRTTAMGHQYGLVGTVLCGEQGSPYIPFGDNQPLRNWMGMQLLHDLNLQVTPYIGGILKKFGYYERDCTFTGYWDAQGKLYDVEPDNIKVSVFRHANKAMLVFLNTANKDTLALWRPMKETGMTGNLVDADPAYGYTFYWTAKDERDFRKIFVPKYDYRLVLVDCAGAW